MRSCTIWQIHFTKADCMPTRNRLIYFAFALLLIIIGLPARLTDWYPEIIVIYIADGIWAMMIYLALAFLFPKTNPVKLLIIAMLGCWIIEFSQLYQEDWINEVRHWPLMGLILGYGFRFEDLTAYTVGIGTAFIVDSIVWRKSVNSEAMLESA